MRLVCLALVALTAYLSSPAQAEKILLIDSYHAGYSWSDQLTDGIKSVIAQTDHELKIHHMDTKRNGSVAFKHQAAVKAKSVIEAYQPDIVIATDDNAQKYLMAPYYLNSDLPFVFAGVNWDASVYGYPAANVTGMIEVSPTMELIDILMSIGSGKTVGFLTADNETNHKDVSYLQKRFEGQLQASFVQTLDAWKERFESLQSEVDFLIIGVTAGIDGFDDEIARQHVMAHTRIPTGGYQLMVRPLVMVSFEILASEQGKWAANAALKILSGTKPFDINIAQNTQGYVVINQEIAMKSGISIPEEILQIADEILE